MGRSHHLFINMSLTLGNLLILDLCCLFHFTGLFNAFDENRDNHIDLRRYPVGYQLVAEDLWQKDKNVSMLNIVTNLQISAFIHVEIICGIKT